MSEIDELIRRLEKEIRQQGFLLENYVAQKNYSYAAHQQGHICGLASALIIAQALYTELAAEKNQALDNEQKIV
jgi:hypothetical protein